MFSNVYYNQYQLMFTKRNFQSSLLVSPVKKSGRGLMSTLEGQHTKYAWHRSEDRMNNVHI